MAHGDPQPGLGGERGEVGMSLHALRAEYRATCAPSDGIIAAINDRDAPVYHHGKTSDLRWALLSVIQETALYAGHADIIREQIDGKTGR